MSLPMHQDNGASTFVLRVTNLKIRYGDRIAVDDISFDIRPGEIFGLLGPNGAGKTSTLSAIEGFLIPYAGSIHVDDVNVVQRPLEARKRMGIQLQAVSFHTDLTVTEIIQLYAGLYGIRIDTRAIHDILRQTGLGESANKRFHQLSGGQQQRLSLIVATIHRPLLLLLDEPTTGLDPQSRRQLWDRIEGLKQSAHSILLTTHSMEEAQSVCDRIAIIDHGTILVIDTPTGLIERYRDDPRIKRLSRGDVTLEDVFIGLTGQEVRV